MEGCPVTAHSMESVAGTFVASLKNRLLLFLRYEFHVIIDILYRRLNGVMITVALRTGLTELWHLNIKSCYLPDSGCQNLEGQSQQSL